jgi:hypothetical protein
VIEALLFYTFSMFGLAYIVGHAVVSKWLREKIAGPSMEHTTLREHFVDFLECPACFGFWAGVTMAMIGAVPFDVHLFNLVAWGLFTSGTNFTIAKLTKLI